MVMPNMVTCSMELNDSEHTALSGSSGRVVHSTAARRERLSRSTKNATVTSSSDTVEVSAAAKTMAAQQIRRVPVMENGELCGILSLCDISKNGYDAEVSQALCEISKP